MWPCPGRLKSKVESNLHVTRTVLPPRPGGGPCPSLLTRGKCPIAWPLGLSLPHLSEPGSNPLPAMPVFGILSFLQKPHTNGQGDFWHASVCCDPFRPGLWFWIIRKFSTALIPLSLWCFLETDQNTPADWGAGMWDGGLCPSTHPCFVPFMWEGPENPDKSCLVKVVITRGKLGAVTVA